MEDDFSDLSRPQIYLFGELSYCDGTQFYGSYSQFCLYAIMQKQYFIIRWKLASVKRNANLLASLTGWSKKHHSHI